MTLCKTYTSMSFTVTGPIMNTTDNQLTCALSSLFACIQNTQRHPTPPHALNFVVTVWNRRTCVCYGQVHTLYVFLHYIYNFPFEFANRFSIKSALVCLLWTAVCVKCVLHCTKKQWEMIVIINIYNILVQWQSLIQLNVGRYNWLHCIDVCLVG